MFLIFYLFPPSQVHKALISLDCKKSAGPDSNRAVFLKKISADLIARPIAFIFNLKFKQWSDTKFLEVSNYSAITEGWRFHCVG